MDPPLCFWFIAYISILGKVEALKHLKDDVNEASKGTECGINLEGFDDLKQGDIIQLIKEVEKPGEL